MANIRKTLTALRFDTPSSWWGALWREGIPLGNGLTGACVYGGAARDTVMLTSSLSQWQGNISVLPDICDKIKDVRKLISEGKYRQAESIYPNALISKNYRPMPAVPLPLCDLNIKADIKKPVKEYMRTLNMENGEASVNYKEGGTRFERSMFVSRENDFFVMELTKSGNEGITAEFSFSIHDKRYALTAEGIYSKLPEAVMTKYEPYFMYFSARNDNGTDFGAVAKISYYGGSMEIGQEYLRIKGANSILVIVKVFTESHKEKEWKNIKTLLAANKLTYDKLIKEHTKQYSKLFKTAELDLDAEGREHSCEELLKNCSSEEADKALLEKLWYFGRYLLVSSSLSEGNRLSNPCGLWCGDYKGALSYPDFHGEMQSVYRFALDNNLCSFLLPLFGYFEGCMADLRKNAQRLFNCKGIFIPAVTSPGTGLLGSTKAKDIYYMAVTGDIANMFFDYGCYTGDKKFIKERAMPFMKEAILFYEDFLKIDESGCYGSSPSYSPEDCPSNFYDGDNGSKIYIAKNSEVDFAVVRQLLENLIEGCTLTGLYKDETVKWEDMLTKLPKQRITASSLVDTYNTADLTESFKTGYGYSLYGVYPCADINSLSEPELKKAYVATLKKRASESMTSMKGHTLGYLSCVASRLADEGMATELISQLIKACVMHNMVTANNDWRNMGYTDNDAWAPYQINGNTSLCGAITSLFLCSDRDNIFLLPCAQSFKSGSIRGILTRSGCEVNIDWDYRKGIRLGIKAAKTCKINVVLPDFCKRVAKGPVTAIDENKVIRNIEIAGGKMVAFEIKT